MLMGTPPRVRPNFPADLSGSGRSSAAAFRNESLPALRLGPHRAGWRVFAGGSRRRDLPRCPPTKRIPENAELAGTPPRLQTGPQWSLATVTPTTVPARYNSRLLCRFRRCKGPCRRRQRDLSLVLCHRRPRLFVAAPQGDDVFFGSDDHRLYKVDVDSGILIWEFVTGDKSAAPPRSRTAGSSPPRGTASFTRSRPKRAGSSGSPRSPNTPAPRQPCSGDRVFLGDEKGTMRCVDADTGREALEEANWAASFPPGRRHSARRGVRERAGERRPVGLDAEGRDRGNDDARGRASAPSRSPR